MGYCHIINLYRIEAQKVLMFRWVWVLEKIHGTSAHIRWKDGRMTYFSGGESHAKFVALFDEVALVEAFQAMGVTDACVYGEAYGGKCQGMAATYGNQLRFIAFDVAVESEGKTCWLDVPDADAFAQKLGQEFVPYHKVYLVPDDRAIMEFGLARLQRPVGTVMLTMEDFYIKPYLGFLDAERDRPSEVAVRRGCGGDKKREGVVVRPPEEMVTKDGHRIMAKHKGADFSERQNVPQVDDPAKLAVLTDASKIAFEWVVPMRLEHVLTRLRADADTSMELDIKLIPKVIAAMIEDVLREAKGEIVESKEVKAAIGRQAAKLFKAHLNKRELNS